MSYQPVGNNWGGMNQNNFRTGPYGVTQNGMNGMQNMHNFQQNYQNQIQNQVQQQQGNFNLMQNQMMMQAQSNNMQNNMNVNGGFQWMQQNLQQQQQQQNLLQNNVLTGNQNFVDAQQSQSQSGPQSIFNNPNLNVNNSEIQNQNLPVQNQGPQSQAAVPKAQAITTANTVNNTSNTVTTSNAPRIQFKFSKSSTQTSQSQAVGSSLQGQVTSKSGAPSMMTAQDDQQANLAQSQIQNQIQNHGSNQSNQQPQTQSLSQSQNKQNLSQSELSIAQTENQPGNYLQGSKHKATVDSEVPDLFQDPNSWVDGLWRLNQKGQNGDQTQSSVAIKFMRSLVRMELGGLEEMRIMRKIHEDENITHQSSTGTVYNHDKFKTSSSESGSDQILPLLATFYYDNHLCLVFPMLWTDLRVASGLIYRENVKMIGKKGESEFQSDSSEKDIKIQNESSGPSDWATKPYDVDIVNDVEATKSNKQVSQYQNRKNMVFLNNTILVKSWSRQLLQGLSFLHKKGIVHADIKSDNILISDPRPVMQDFSLIKESESELISLSHLQICDFGSAFESAVRQDDPSIMNHNHLGALWYRAPELLLTLQINSSLSQIDIWSAACVIFEMFSSVLFREEAIEVANSNTNLTKNFKIESDLSESNTISSETFCLFAQNGSTSTTATSPNAQLKLLQDRKGPLPIKLISSHLKTYKSKIYQNHFVLHFDDTPGINVKDRQFLLEDTDSLSGFVILQKKVSKQEFVKTSGGENSNSNSYVQNVRIKELVEAWKKTQKGNLDVDVDEKILNKVQFLDKMTAFDAEKRWSALDCLEKSEWFLNAKKG